LRSADPRSGPAAPGRPVRAAQAAPARHAPAGPDPDGGRLRRAARRRPGPGRRRLHVQTLRPQRTRSPRARTDPPPRRRTRIRPAPRAPRLRPERARGHHRRRRRRTVRPRDQPAGNLPVAQRPHDQQAPARRPAVRMGRRSHHQCHRGLHPPAAQEDRTGRRPHPDRTRPGVLPGARQPRRAGGHGGRRLTARPDMFADSVPRRPRRHATLLGRILLWMIVPLFVLWSIGIVITYFISLNIANSPYDRTLASHLRLLRHEVEQQRLASSVALSESARTVLAGSADEPSTSWQILDANGNLLAGDPSIPTPENWGYDIDQIRFRNASLDHQAIRMAYVWGGRDQDGTGFLTVVAEPAEARATLQQEILTGMLTPQLIILPLAAMLAGLGLTQGLEPLSLLQEHMRRRKPSDLSPLRDDLAPAEIVPLIASMNNVLQRLSDSIESQRRFVANAAHQLKTPLAGIRTQCELALREKDPEKMTASLQQLQSGSQRATRLVNQLLALARAENLDHATAYSSAAFDLNELAEACTLEWVGKAIERGIDLGFDPAEEPLPIFGSRVMINELLNNLIDNALL